MTKVYFHKTARSCNFKINFFEYIVKECAIVLKKNNLELEINIVGDYLIKKLNNHYRGINKKTDVLAFAWQEEKEIKNNFLGQIYISYPQIIRQSKTYKITVKEEVTRMTIHGILHLLGYDHKNKNDSKLMFSLQEKILKLSNKK
jgi:probable rRNA maturation factor